MDKETITDSAVSQEIARWEKLALGGLLVLAFVLRVWDLSANHIEHFDEGVYASNRWFTADEEQRFPNRHLYAPPLWPAVLEWSQLLLGTSAWGLFLPAILLGTISVGLVWAIVRKLTHPVLALVVAAIVATSEFHILYSRTALTDVPMTTFMLSGILCGINALDRSSWRWAILGGLATGIGWSIKYNGWFPLAVLGTAIVARGLFHGKPLRSVGRDLAMWLVMASVAFAVWIPSLLDLHAAGRGGYAEVQANHARYIQGFAHWWDNLQIVLAQLTWWESDWLRTGFAAAMAIGSAILIRRPDEDEWFAGRNQAAGMVAIVLAIVLLLGWMSLMFWLVVFGLLGVSVLALELLSRKGAELHPHDPSRWVVLIWFVSLLLVTPLYTPYPRLALPWLVSWWIVAGIGIDFFFDALRFGRSHLMQPKVMHSLLILFVVFVAFLIPVTANKIETSAWQLRDGVVDAANQIVESSGPVGSRVQSNGVRSVVYVYGEPELFYQLCRVAPQDVLIVPASSLDFIKTHQQDRDTTTPIFLVTGPHSGNDRSFQEAFQQVESSLISVEKIAVPASDLLLMNLIPNFALATERPLETVTFGLYRLRPD